MISRRHTHRRALDKYFTAPWQVRALMTHQRLGGIILEPCVGDGAIANILRRYILPATVITNDIDPACEADHHFDAADPHLYEATGPVDFVVTNPPFQMPLCRDIVANAVRHARIGVAMVLPLSFREPTAKVNPRGPFLAAHPISRLLTMPRYSYTGNGRSANMTTEWVLWIRDPAYNLGQPILSLYRADEALDAHRQRDAPVVEGPARTGVAEPRPAPEAPRPV